MRGVQGRVGPRLEGMPHSVGVVVRTANRPDFLRRALADISRQTLTDASVVVVNDGGAADVVREVVAASAIADRTVVVDTVAPGGRCAAANAGIARLTSNYVVLHDDDDLWDPSFLARTAAHLDAHPEHAGVGVATEIVYEELRAGTWVEVSRVPFWRDLERLRLIDMMEKNRAVPISLLYRRALHEDVGPYDERLSAVEDWEFYLRALSRYDFGFIGGAPLAFWTQRPGARGAAGNSMFTLEEQHSHDDLQVRDRELRAWVSREGLGMPLYIADIQRRLSEEMRRGFDRQLEAMRAEIDAHQPLLSRLRKLRRRLRRER